MNDTDSGKPRVVILTSNKRDQSVIGYNNTSYARIHQCIDSTSLFIQILFFFFIDFAQEIYLPTPWRKMDLPEELKSTWNAAVKFLS